jgi:hypothetical protein
MVILARGQLRAPIPISGHVNHTMVEDIPEGEEVLTSTFLLFGRPIIILFDSGASHGFITSACAKKGKVVSYSRQAIIYDLHPWKPN